MGGAIFEARSKPNQLNNIATLMIGCVVGYMVLAAVHRLSNRFMDMGVALFTGLSIMNFAALIIILVWYEFRASDMTPLSLHSVLMPDM